MQLHGKSGALVKVRVNNKEFGSYSLNKNQSIRIGEDDWENILEIKNGKASMIKADCPDKICVIMPQSVKRVRLLFVCLIKLLLKWSTKMEHRKRIR